jgi:DNA-binding MarR family transcriptional regulator
MGQDTDQHYSDLGRVGQVIWDILALSNHLHDIRQAWAKYGGVSGPQWMILFALSTLDEGKGVPVGRISEQLHVKSTFVTTQSKALEEKGFVSRTPSDQDRRVVLLKLTEKALADLSAIHEKRDVVHRKIFGVFTDAEFRMLAEMVSRLEQSSGEAAAIMRVSRN